MVKWPGQWDMKIKATKRILCPEILTSLTTLISIWMTHPTIDQFPQPEIWGWILTFWAGKFLGMVCPVHCGMFSSIHGLYLLVTSSIPFSLLTTKNGYVHYQMWWGVGQDCPRLKHCLRWLVLTIWTMFYLDLIFVLLNVLNMYVGLWLLGLGSLSLQSLPSDSTFPWVLLVNLQF